MKMDYLVNGAASLSLIALGATNLTGFTSMQPALSIFALASVGAAVAYHGVKVNDDDKPKPIKAAIVKAVSAATGLPETPADSSWCQFCDEIKPVGDFKLDIVGRWVCADCRKEGGTDEPEVYAGPPKKAADKRAESGHNPPCAVCGLESVYYMKMPDGTFEHRCTRCAACPRPYTPEEQRELQLKAAEDFRIKSIKAVQDSLQGKPHALNEVMRDAANQLAAIHAVPPADIAQNQVKPVEELTAEALTAKFDNPYTTAAQASLAHSRFTDWGKNL